MGPSCWSSLLCFCCVFLYASHELGLSSVCLKQCDSFSQSPSGSLLLVFIFISWVDSWVTQVEQSWTAVPRTAQALVVISHRWPYSHPCFHLFLCCLLEFSSPLFMEKALQALGKGLSSRFCLMCIGNKTAHPGWISQPQNPISRTCVQDEIQEGQCCVSSLLLLWFWFLLVWDKRISTFPHA